MRATFKARSVLMRYIDDVQRFGSRPAPDAFRKNPNADHLSVNLVGVESRAEIISYYRARFQRSVGNMAVCEHRVHEYNDACNRTKIQLTYNSSQGNWEFPDQGGNLAPAYRLRPFTPSGSQHSPSHAGVEYVRVFDELDELRFARRMCRKRFHLL